MIKRKIFAAPIVGGPGNDNYLVTDPATEIFELFGGGYDTVYATVDYTLTAGSEIEVLTVYDRDTVNAQNLAGNEYANTIYGNQGSNFLNGNGGADTLYGLGGDDRYLVDSADDVVVEFIGGGFDTVYAAASHALAGGAEIEVLTVYDRDTVNAVNLTGNGFNSLIYGNNGSNTLIGGGGVDIFYGLGGDDRYLVDSLSGQVFEAQGGGYDTVYTFGDFALNNFSYVEALTVYDRDTINALTLFGNNLDNVIYGNNGSNALLGGGGTDTLYGLGGDDRFVIDSADDVVIEFAGGGNDTVYTTVSYALAADAEVETLAVYDRDTVDAVSLSGSSFANTIYGNNGSNFLNGNGGADSLYGLGGDDRFLVDSADDLVIEFAGQGFDTVYTTTSHTLAAGAEIEVLTVYDRDTTNALGLAGNGFANIIYGNAAQNLVEGHGGADTLYGMAGDDILDGGLGADSLIGGDGRDSFAFTAALGSGNVDTLIGYDSVDDAILLGGQSGQPFAALASGILWTSGFRAGTVALDSNDMILYDSITGAIFYDADGNGAGAAVQFAWVSPGTVLYAMDFVVSGPENIPPTITSGGIASIAENSPASTIVYQTIASDADGDRITYVLEGADAHLLTIDSNGAVRLIDPANFETKSSYSFTVRANDSTGSFTAVRPVTLSIIDVVEGNTPIINETQATNDSTGQAQGIGRGELAVSPNPNLPDDDQPSATIRGTIASATDRDFFAITLQAGERLTLDIDNSNGGLDPHVRIYGPNGAEIGDNDDLVSFDPGSVPTIAQHNTDSFFTFRAPTAGTYYFSVEAFGALSLGGYDLHVTISPPATAAQLIQEDIESLISGAAWPSDAITYSFPDSSTDYPPGFGDPEDPEVPSFAPFTALQQGVVQSLLQHISTLTELTFQQLTGAADRDAQLRFAMTDGTGAAHAYYPGNYIEAGSAWFNKQDFNTPQKGNYAWMGILHETGHALGLKHGHELPAIQGPRDSVEYTVMTYRSYPGDPLSGGYSNETWGYPQTLMMYDIAALQKIYGANYTFNSGNSVYSWSSSTGEMSVNGVGQGAPGNGAGGSANRIFMTVWDGGGSDTYDLSNYSPNGGVVIDLRPGEWTRTNSSQTANLGNGNVARGNIANALLFEGNTASAIENAKGGAGHDTLIANLVANQLTGNGGADIFMWMSVEDAGMGAQADTVLDFLRDTDKINFHNLDTNPSSPWHENFRFIGTDTFHNIAGEVRYEVIGGNAHIFADADGDSIADMEIILTNVTILTTSDFNF